MSLASPSSPPPVRPVGTGRAKLATLLSLGRSDTGFSLARSGTAEASSGPTVLDPAHSWRRQLPQLCARLRPPRQLPPPTEGPAVKDASAGLPSVGMMLRERLARPVKDSTASLAAACASCPPCAPAPVAAAVVMAARPFSSLSIAESLLVRLDEPGTFFSKDAVSASFMLLNDPLREPSPSSLDPPSLDIEERRSRRRRISGHWVLLEPAPLPRAPEPPLTRRSELQRRRRRLCPPSPPPRPLRAASAWSFPQLKE